MTDLWGFLLQTLTASGVAGLLLVVKAMFRDKLTPRWQFAAWSIPALALLLPVGLGGRYVLLPWPWLVETAKTLLTGDYSLTCVRAPVPLPRLQMPDSVADWLYAVYVAGVIFLLLRYLISYLRLRLALRRGTMAGEACRAQIEAVARRYDLSPCRAAEISGLSSAFLCGVLRPVLALPAGREVDDKVILHELLHKKYRDTAWGLVICLFRCLHWCNPLLWYCANRAGNDLEARCDQRVLELLEGEERRDYGRNLLSMTDENYARTPGTSSMANGARNIGRRIEAIARFKLYPAGMTLGSVCMVLLLATPLLGVRGQAVYEGRGQTSPLEISLSMASARTLTCTTPAGALDTYAKAVLGDNGYYRAMCAPLSQQKEIADELLAAAQENQWPLLDSGLPRWPDGHRSWPNTESGYQIYNLDAVGKDAYEGLLVVELYDPVDGGQSTWENGAWLGVQRIRAERENGRWVVLPLEEFRTVQTSWNSLPAYGCDELPSFRYEAQAEDFTVSVRYQTAFTVDSYVQTGSGFFSSSSFDLTPQPHGEFTAQDGSTLYVVYTGDPADKGQIASVGVSAAPIWEDEARPELQHAGWGSSGGSGSDGSLWGSRSLGGSWNDALTLAGGGTYYDPADLTRPAAFAADFYLNNEKTAELTLLPMEGSAAP